MKTTTGFAAVALALAGAGCAGLRDQAATRADTVLTQEDQQAGNNQRTRQAGIECIPGRRVRIEVELTGNVVPPPSDTIIGEALCDGTAVGSVQATAQPPIGHDSNRGNATQASGPAACRASWTFMPNPNAPAWKVTCRFE